MLREPEKHPWLYGSLALLILLALAFVAGRYSMPVRVEEKVRVETVVQEKVVEVEKVVVKREVVQAKAKVIVRTVRELVHPDGTVERESKTEAKSATTTAAAEQETTDKASEVRRDLRSSEDLSRSVERYDPMWKVGLLGGVELSSAAPAPTFGVQGGVRLWALWGTLQVQSQGKTLTVLGGVALEL